jgi:hypothetical protein
MGFMAKIKYTCQTCNKAFSRRWNAQRHNDSLHNGLSHISTKYISKDRNDAFAISGIYNKSTKDMITPRFGKFKRPPQNSVFRKHLPDPLYGSSSFSFRKIPKTLLCLWVKTRRSNSYTTFLKRWHSL